MDISKCYSLTETHQVERPHLAVVIPAALLQLQLLKFGPEVQAAANGATARPQTMVLCSNLFIIWPMVYTQTIR